MRSILIVLSLALTPALAWADVWRYETEKSIAWTDSKERIQEKYLATAVKVEFGKLQDYKRITLIPAPKAPVVEDCTEGKEK